MSISDNLRVIRNRKNISQQEIADFLGVDRKTYVNLESGMEEVGEIPWIVAVPAD